MNAPDAADRFAEAELLILPNGTLLVHNLTPAAAAVLLALNPTDSAMLQRATSLGRSAQATAARETAPDPCP